MKIALALVLSSCMLLQTAFRLYAVSDVIWTNTLGGSWHSALNWSPLRIFELVMC